MLESHEHKQTLHDFDGIQENRENSPPAYFTVLFYGLIIWGVAFAAFYMLSGWSSQGEFRDKMSGHDQRYQQEAQGEQPGGAPAGQVAAAAPTDDSASDAAAIFAQRCAMCHGEDGKGGIGPDLTTPQFKFGKTVEEISESIASGRPGGMPPFANDLPKTEIEALAHFLLSL